jgi:CheY-like chemotaxis protein
MRAVGPGASRGAGEEAGTPRRGRVLLVDDDRAILLVLSRALAREHDCTCVNLASEALTRVAAGERFDVILCDLMMPVMSGMDLFNELEKVAPEQAEQMVFLTGGAFTPKLHEFLALVPNERIHKPFEVSTLKECVRLHVQ